jgi:cytoskeletal protein CcmA (bactofilin family)
MAYQTPDCKITGTIKFDGPMRIDGKVDGEIITDNGELVIGETGTAKATINTKSAIIEGRVKGKITASGKVVLKQKAHLVGDLKAKTLVVEEGVVLIGRCNIKP